METRPSEIRFGSFLVYPSHARAGEPLRYKRTILYIKEDRFNQKVGMRMPQYAVMRLSQMVPGSALQDFFVGDPLLVPIPRSGLLQKDALWPALRICEELVARGFATRSEAVLKRVTAVRKSALTTARPSPKEHFDSLSAGFSSATERVVLVDDVITRGASALGAAWRLLDIMPGLDLKVFALARTLTAETVPSFVDIQVGTIRLRGENSLEREP